MTPDELTALATVAGVAVAGLFGLTGFVIGLISLHISRQAKQSADSANNIAEEANAISKSANSLSSESNSIAREANRISQAGEIRAAEQDDVTWDFHWKSPGQYAIRNEGKNTAFNVWIQISVDDEVREVSFPQVVGGEIVLLSMPRSERVWEAEQRKEEERKNQRRSSNGFLGGLSVAMYSMPAPNYHYMRDRVMWRTALGTPRQHDESSNFGSAGP